jgi:(2Fe-2S) ferredoxin
MSYRLYLCHGPNCSARSINHLRAHLTTLLREHQLDASVEVHASGCQDHCAYGPNLLIHPGGIRYVGLTTERLVRIVSEHLISNHPITEWLATSEMRRR